MVKVYRGLLGGLRFLAALLPLTLWLLPSARAQQGDEFWFDIPEINRGHTANGPIKYFLHVAALDYPVRVTLELPAEQGFTPLSFVLQTGEEKKLELAAGGTNFTNPAAPLSLFYKPQYSGSGTGHPGPSLHTATPAERPKYIENLLAWAESDLSTPGKYYINRTNKGVRMRAEILDTVWKSPGLISLMDYRREKLLTINEEYQGVTPTDPLWSTYRNKLITLEQEIARARRMNYVPGTTTVSPGLYYDPFTLTGSNAPWKFRPGLGNESRKLITGYIEISTGWNMDLIALKGENAKGRRFFVPMQTHYSNSDSRYDSFRARPYASFNIVATADDTKVRVKTPRPIFARSNSMSYGGTQVTQTQGKALHEYELYFEKAGQSCIIVPYGQNSVNGGDSYQYYPGTEYSNSDVRRLQGSQVEVVNGGEVVVLTREDIVFPHSGNPDYVADQLIPESLFGQYYGVLQGDVSGSGPYREHIYAVASQDNTKVTLTRLDGTTQEKTVNKGEQADFLIDNTTTERAVNVTASKPVILFQMSGASRSGASQRAGAVIPAMPNSDGVCVGSKEVVFSRAKGGGYKMFLNLVAWDFTGTPSAIGNFELHQSTGGAFTRVQPGTAGKILEDKINAHASWQDFPGSATDPQRKWKWFRAETDAIAGGAITTGVTYKLLNRGNVFQLGVLNGDPGQDAFFGYFSDFAEIKVAVQPETINPQTGLPLIIPGSNIVTVCRGESALLKTGLPDTYTFEWTTTSSVGADKILTPRAADTWIIRPQQGAGYKVTVTGFCQVKQDRTIQLQVGENFNPRLAVPNRVCVPPSSTPGTDGTGTVTARLKGLRGATKIIWYKEDQHQNFQQLDELNLVGAEESASYEFPVTYKHSNLTAAPVPPKETQKFKVKIGNAQCVKELDMQVDLYPGIAPQRIELKDNSGNDISELCAPAIMFSGTGSPTSWTPPGVGSTALTSANFKAPRATNLGGIPAGNRPNGLKFQWTLPSVVDMGTPPMPLDVENLTQVNIKKPTVDPLNAVVGLRVTDGHGVCSQEATAPLVIHKAPEVGISWLLGQQVCENVFDDENTGRASAQGYIPGVQLTWKLEKTAPTTSAQPLGDQGFVTLKNKVEPGDYRLELKASRPGCETGSTSAVEFKVKPSPKVVSNGGFRVAVPTGKKNPPCSPAELNAIVKNISNATRIEWEMRDPTEGISPPFRFKGSQAFPPTGTPPMPPSVPEAKFKYQVVNRTNTKQKYAFRYKLSNADGCEYVGKTESLDVYPSSPVLPISESVVLCPKADGSIEATIAPLFPGLPPDKIIWKYGTGSNSATLPEVNPVTTPGAPGLQQDRKSFIIKEIYTKNVSEKRLLVVRTELNQGAASCGDEKVIEVTIRPYVKQPSVRVNVSGIAGQLLAPEHPDMAICAPATMTFTADPPIIAGDRVGYRWDVGVVPLAPPGTPPGTPPGATVWDGETTGGERSYTVKTDNTGKRRTGVVKLTAYNEYCPDIAKTVEQKFHYYPKLKPEFTMDVKERCNPVEIELSAQVPVAGHKEKWTFGTPENMGEPKPGSTTQLERVYTKPGIVKIGYTLKYNVTSAAIAADGCAVTVEKQLEIPKPLDISGWRTDLDHNMFCAPEKLNLTMDLVDPSSNDKEFIKWDFGDGRVIPKDQKMKSVEHTYTNNGTTRQLKVLKVEVGQEGKECLNPENRVKRIRWIPLHIMPKTEAQASVQVTDACAPVKVELNHSLSRNADNFEWKWTPSVGHGVAGSETVQGLAIKTVTLPNSSPSDNENYILSLKAWKEHHVNEVAVPKNSTTTPPVPGYPAFTGDKTCSDEKSPVATVTAPPEVKPLFSLSASEVCSGTEVSFTDESTGGAGLTSTWEFGDGSSANSTPGQTVKHVFMNQGANDLKLTVRMTTQRGNSCQAQAERVVTVHPEVKADFTLTTSDRCYSGGSDSKLRVTTVNTSRYNTSTGPDSPTNSFTWEYGDGTKKEGSNKDQPPYDYDPSRHPYEKGEYTLSLEVSQTYTSGMVCKDRAEKKVEVLPKLLVDFAASVDKLCTSRDPANAVTFLPTFNSGGKVSDVQFTWDFGDGTQETKKGLQEVKHLFTNTTSAAKDYTVTMTAKNEFGCEVAKAKTVKVFAKVDAKIVLKNVPNPLCEGSTVTIMNGSAGGPGVTFQWFKDGAPWAGPGIGNEVNHQLVNTTNGPKVEVFHLIITREESGVRCTGEAEYKITIPPKLESKFTIVGLDGADVGTKPGTTEQLVQGCNPVKIQLDNNSRGASRFEWDLGDLNFPVTKDVPNQVYTNNDQNLDRDVVITLKAFNNNGCEDVMKAHVKVFPTVKAAFTPTIAEGCGEVAVQFDNISKSPRYGYEWDFGQGGKKKTGTRPEDREALTDAELKQETPPEVYFRDPASDKSRLEYVATPRLRVWLKDQPKCKDELSGRVIVKPNVYPSFTLNPKEVCAPYQLEVNPKLEGAPAEVFEWELFDGTVRKAQGSTQHFIERLENPSATQDKEYVLKLKVLTKDGCVGTWEDKIKVRPKPQVDFTMVAKGSQNLCPPVEMEFRGSSGSAGSGDEYTWDFDDGSPLMKGQTVNHIFTNENAGASITRHVRLTVKNAKGCTSELSKPLTIKPQIRADLRVAPGDVGCSPFEVVFHNASRTGDLAGVNYTWDFGDGSPLKENNNSKPERHTFVNESNAPKDYLVKLTLLSAEGCKHEATTKVTVNPTPKANFTVSPTDMVYPQSVVRIVPPPPRDTSWRYQWEFGDGNTSGEPNVTEHRYEKWGPKERSFEYSITLRVNNGLCEAQSSRSVVIRPPKPQANFTMKDSAGCPGMKVKFLNTSKYAESYEWDFGVDSKSTSRSPDPEFIFERTGIYHVHLRARGEGGVADTALFVEVYPKPVVDFEINPEKQTKPESTIHAINKTAYGHTYLWNFGDGAVSEEESPTHTYQEAGEYTVKLVARSINGCVSDTAKSPAVWIYGVGAIRFPTVFRPNPEKPQSPTFSNMTAMNRDAQNQVFHPYIEGDVRKYRLQIFNRWGEQVFETTNPLEGFSGYLNGELAPMSVYAYRCTGEFYDGDLFDLKGNVTLLQ